jgi:hypothetical protein
MPQRDQYPEFLLRQILEQQQRIINELQEIKHQMSTNPPVTQAQFTADLATFQTALTTMITDVQADIAALKAQVAAGQTPDFSALDATVQTMSTAVSSENTSAEGDLNPPSATASSAVRKS